MPSSDLIVGDTERTVATGLHLLHSGDAAAAVAALEPLRQWIAPRVNPNVSSATALAHVAAGDVEAALLAAGEVEGHRGATYLDRVLAGVARGLALERRGERSAEHTSELQSLKRISYAVFCLRKTTP